MNEAIYQAIAAELRRQNDDPENQIGVYFDDEDREDAIIDGRVNMVDLVAAIERAISGRQ